MFQDENSNFKNPPAGYRIIPFWFWNGDMAEEIVLDQIREMAEKGLGGFFLCARQGLEIPYLSQAWFERVKFAIEAARQYGLQVWLYDEYPYPSGMSGGEVILQHPDAKQYNLLHFSEKVASGQPLELELPWARLLFAKAVPLVAGKLDWTAAIDLTKYVGNYQAQTVFQKTGLTMYNDKRFFTYEPRKRLTWQAPAGEWQVIVFLEQAIEDFKYYGTYLDPCHAEAVQTFIDTTYEPYAAHFGQDFGETIKGMFSDEVGIYGNPPWSPLLPEKFAQRHGYSLKDNLAALRYPVGENFARTRYDYFQTLHIELREAYHKKIGEWCGAHGIKYITEVPSVRATTQLYSHITGGDSAHEKLGRSLEWTFDLNILNFRANPKNVSSLSRQLGLDRAFIECFHSVGWSMTMQDAKWMLDRLAAMGINFFNFHAFFYTLDGLRKHDAPPSQFLQNPYWPHFKQLGDYAGRLCYALSRGTAAVSIAVLDPTTSLWTHLGNPFHQFEYCGNDPAEEKRLAQLKADWAYTCKTLYLNQLDYDHLDPEVLATAEITPEGLIKLGHAAYAVLILPPMTNLEAAAWHKIKEFLAAGGTVVSLGSLPYESIDGEVAADALAQFGLTDSPKATYWQDSTSESFSGWVKGEQSAYFLPAPGGVVNSKAGPPLLSFLKELIAQPVKLEVAESDRKSLMMQVRDWPDGSKVVFVANQEGNSIEAGLIVEDLTLGEAVELDLASGETRPVKAAQAGESWRISFNLAPYQSRLFHIGGTQAANSAAKEIETPSRLTVPAARDWTVKALQPNIVRLANFHFALDPENIGLEQGWPDVQAGADWPVVEVKTLIDQCRDLAKMKNLELPLDFRQIFGTPVKMQLAYPLTGWYQTSFEVETLPSACTLVFDAKAIAGNYQIFLNGREVDAAGFGPFRIYDHCNRGGDITPLLKPGRNTLVVRVEAGHDWDGLTDPLYLAGNFGVYFDGDHRPVIGKTPETAELRGGILPGFPFYAGTLALTGMFELDEMSPGETFEFAFSGLDPDLHDCLEVLLNGVSLGAKAWTPYLWRGSRELLRPGQNRLEVRLSNTLSGMLEGKYFDYQTHKLVNI